MVFEGVEKFGIWLDLVRCLMEADS